LKRQIELIYIDSGGGHRAAANALAEVVRQQQRPWDLRMYSIQDLLDSIDFIRKTTGVAFQDVYNIMLRRGWTLGSAQLIPVMHLLIRVSHRAQVRVLEGHWAADRPDMVVSLIPHYNRALRQALDRTWPGTPYVTMLTDIADYPPHFWIERQDQYVICGSERAAAQARRIGLPDERILRTSGMVLDPRFHAAREIDRAAERMRLGLRGDLPTGLVLFGGEGSLEMEKIARLLNQSGLDIQLILICGRHQEAARAIRALPRRIPMLIEGFTREIPFYMQLADFFIGKPGPGSISEALTSRLPVIVERNAWTLAHERSNTQWIEEQGVGLVIPSFSKIAGAVRELLRPERYESCRRHAARMRNSAVYEIPSLLDRVFREHALTQAAATPRPSPNPKRRFGRDGGRQMAIPSAPV
jgi:1,2-diacylglycerol 3-beta-galactosyltransferase